MPANAASGSEILANLGPADFALLQPSLEVVDLPVHRQLERSGRTIEHVYFLESGLASMVVSSGLGRTIDVGLVGKEGMTGLPILMHVDRPAYDTIMHTAGTAQRISTESLHEALEKSPSLHRSLLRYAHTLVTQLAYTSLANGRYKIQERMARWLLMADDRANGGAIHLTHEFLAAMLGLRRPGVTNALSEFQKRGVLLANRGVIAIQQRGPLEEAANGSYGVPETEYLRVFSA